MPTLTEKSPLPTAAASQNTSLKEQLFKSLKTSDEYRYAFVEERLQTGLAAQIHTIREQRGLDPKQFAEKLGKKLAWVYRLEDPNQPPPTIPSLIEVAKAYDCDLEVRFRPFSETLNDLDRLSTDSLRVASFKDESLEIEHMLSIEAAYTSIGTGRYRSAETDWIRALADHAAAPAPLEGHYWGEVSPAFQPEAIPMQAALEAFNATPEGIGNLVAKTPDLAAWGAAPLSELNLGNVTSIEEYRNRSRHKFVRRGNAYGRASRQRRARA